MSSKTIRLSSYSHKGEELIATLKVESPPPISLPSNIVARQFDYYRPIPMYGEFPTFIMTPATQNDREIKKLKGFLQFLSRGVTGTSVPRCLRIHHENNWIFLMPPADPQDDTRITCCFTPFSSSEMGQISHPQIQYPNRPLLKSPNPPLKKQKEEDKDKEKLKKEKEKEKEKEETEMAGEDEAGAIHPRFLKTQSHIHAEWILGAFAEIIHNSFDANSSRLFIYVDFPSLSSSSSSSSSLSSSSSSLSSSSTLSSSSSLASPIIHFVDNGVGMQRKDLVRMLCFGHEDEGDVGKIGKFGVGFKTGSMRIGDDTMVFTRNEKTQSVGLLSQTSNQNKKTLTVPIVTWIRETMEYDLSVHNRKQVQNALDYIYSFSPFKNAFMLQSQFEKIETNGTHVVIYNIRSSELDFSDPQDIRVASPDGDLFIKRRQGQQATDVAIDYSLREYCSVMFLKPRMSLSLRNSPVQTRFLSKTLVNTEAHSRNGFKLLLGFNQQDKEKGLGGFMMYWHGVLIQAYHRIGIMIHNTDAGNGVIGIVECDGFEPLNNKQAFNEAKPTFKSTEKWLEECLTHYWYEKIQKDLTLDVDADKLVPQNDWVMCNKCSKWRCLPTGVKIDQLPKTWFCRMNTDPHYNSCDKPEQDSTGEVVVTYNNQTTTKSNTQTGKPTPTQQNKLNNNNIINNNNNDNNNNYNNSKTTFESFPAKTPLSSKPIVTPKTTSSPKPLPTKTNNNNNNNNNNNKNNINNNKTTPIPIPKKQTTPQDTNKQTTQDTNKQKLKIVPKKVRPPEILTAVKPTKNIQTKTTTNTSAINTQIINTETTNTETTNTEIANTVTKPDKTALLKLAAANLEQADKLVQQLQARKLFSEDSTDDNNNNNNNNKTKNDNKKKRRDDDDDDDVAIVPKKKGRTVILIDDD